MDLACERCGRALTGSDRCPRHPGARRLSMDRPEDREWIESLRTLRAQRLRRLAIAAVFIAAFGVSMWSLARGHDTSTLFGGRSILVEVGLVALLGISESVFWLWRNRSQRSGPAASTEEREPAAFSEQALGEQPDGRAAQAPAQQATDQVQANDPKTPRRHLGAGAARTPTAHQS